MRLAFANRLFAAAIGLLLAGTLVLAGGSAAAEDESASSGVSHATLATEALPNVPGKELTALTVELAPGAVSPSHRHAGFVFAYVLSGEVRSRLNDGPAKLFRAGESFVEPPGTVHTLTENPSRTEPARLLVIFVAEADARLTTYDR
jgi:quercetin dioxygenase-like cupin family protein